MQFKAEDDLVVDFANILSAGKYGNIFKGTWKGNPVAIKQGKSIEHHTDVYSLAHENVVRLLHVKRMDTGKQRDISYYALEFCEESLDQYFLKDDDPNKLRGPMPSKKELFLGLSQGMDYIHSKKLIFDDIKPNKVLIFVDSHNRNSKAKWSITGLLNKRVHSREVGQLTEEESIWKAPELTNKGQYEQPETVESNTFAVGLVFAYILLYGKHLYGSVNHEIIDNIRNDKHVNLYSKLI